MQLCTTFIHYPFLFVYWCRVARVFKCATSVGSWFANSLLHWGTTTTITTTSATTILLPLLLWCWLVCILCVELASTLGRSASVMFVFVSLTLIKQLQLLQLLLLPLQVLLLLLLLPLLLLDYYTTYFSYFHFHFQ